MKLRRAKSDPTGNAGIPQRGQNALGQPRLYIHFPTSPPLHPSTPYLCVSLIKQLLLIDFPLRPYGYSKKHLGTTSVDHL